MLFFRLFLLFALFSCSALAQELPSKIRGYSVHKTPITVADGPVPGGGSNERGAIVKVGEPTLLEVSLSGITFEVPGEITSVAQSGRVDFLTFHDFKINGVSVEIEEYAVPFSFSKNQLVILPKPAKLFLPTSTILKAAWREIQGSEKEWVVTGRVFVFGKFRKYGFHHKRVVPLDINLRIKNPLLD